MDYEVRKRSLNYNFNKISSKNTQYHVLLIQLTNLKVYY